MSIPLLLMFGYEWLFFVSAVSPLSTLDLSGKMRVLAFLYFLSVVCGVLFEAVVRGIGRLLPIASHKVDEFLRASRHFFYACLILSFTDNLLYSAFRIGISSSTGIRRAAYTFFFILLLTLIFRVSKKNLKPSKLTVTTMMVFFVLFCVWIAAALTPIEAAPDLKSYVLKKRFNVVLFGVDGMNAENMSLYGYARDTTPRMTAFFKDGVVCESAFANTGRSAGSVTSMLTGRYPSELLLYQRPSILKGEDVFRHLPGIFCANGYEAMQEGVRVWMDSPDLNMQNGFASANGRRIGSVPQLLVPVFMKLSYEIYFSEYLFGRLRDRLLHIFWIRENKNPFDQVTRVGPQQRTKDEDHMKNLKRFVDRAQGPFFLHVHLMETNGPQFFPKQRHFSGGIDQSKGYMKDFYDDTIVQADGYFGDFMDYLSEKGLLQNTVVVLYSDHGMMHNGYRKVPLAFRFPDVRPGIRIKENTQLLDVAPTLLDYFGSSAPSWMDGQSLLGGTIKKDRPILFFDPDRICRIDRSLRGRNRGFNPYPPLYGLKHISVLICDRRGTFEMESGKIRGSSFTRNPRWVGGKCDGKKVLKKDLEAVAARSLEGLL